MNHMGMVVAQKPYRYYYYLTVHFGMTERILPSPYGTVKPIANAHLH